jgi:hypothetical protein
VHYEHIIQINDFNNPMLVPLSRRQLWMGLLRRAERPEEFLIGVERVTVVERGPDWFRREMQLGKLTVLDHISLEEETSVHFQTEASEQHDGGSFLMRIEEPSPGALFVRFVYKTSLPETGPMDTEAGDAYFASYVKAAYRDTDVDSIRKIRELLETGELD